MAALRRARVNHDGDQIIQQRRQTVVTAIGTAAATGIVTATGTATAMSTAAHVPTHVNRLVKRHRMVQFHALIRLVIVHKPLQLQRQHLRQRIFRTAFGCVVDESETLVGVDLAIAARTQPLIGAGESLGRHKGSQRLMQGAASGESSKQCETRKTKCKRIR